MNSLTDNPDLSIIVLLEQQYPDFFEYIAHLSKLFSENGKKFEILVVANGTGNFFRSQLNQLRDSNIPIRAFEFGTRTTQAVCLKAILKEARGKILLICGSYQQLPDASILNLVNSMNDEIDLINPWRKLRVDPAFNQFQSKIFNWLVNLFVKTDLHDFSCTVKVCRRVVLEETELYGNMFRFLPVLAAAKGFRVKEIPAEHHQERGKTGFYSYSEYITRLIDIFTLFFNTRFSRKPLRFFSAAGVVFIFSGLFSMLILFGQRFFSAVPVGNRPFFFLALLITILGVLIASAGLLGEIIAFTNGRHKKEYTIEKVI